MFEARLCCIRYHVISERMITTYIYIYMCVSSTIGVKCINCSTDFCNCRLLIVHSVHSAGDQICVSSFYHRNYRCWCIILLVFHYSYIRNAIIGSMRAIIACHLAFFLFSQFQRIQLFPQIIQASIRLVCLLQYVGKWCIAVLQKIAVGRPVPFPMHIHD